MPKNRILFEPLKKIILEKLLLSYLGSVPNLILKKDSPPSVVLKDTFPAIKPILLSQGKQTSLNVEAESNFNCRKDLDNSSLLLNSDNNIITNKIGLLFS